MNPRFACPTCNAPLEHDGRSTTARCDYCGTVAIVPETMRPAAGASPGQSIPPSTTPPSPAQVEAARHKQEAINDIMELVRAGRQEEATQLYHQTFKVSLKEAKRTVANLATNERNNAPAKGRLSSFLSGLFGSDND